MSRDGQPSVSAASVSAGVLPLLVCLRPPDAGLRQRKKHFQQKIFKTLPNRDTNKLARMNESLKFMP